MRVLHYIEPLVMHGRPFHYWAWLDYAVRSARALRAASPDVDVRFVMNAALATRALAAFDPSPAHPPARGQGLSPGELALLSRRSLCGDLDASAMDVLGGLQRGGLPKEVVAALGENVRAALRGFEPDVIVTRTPSAHLRAAFPRAVVLHTELGPFSRHPFALTCFYDPRGLWAESLPAVHAQELLARAPTAEEGALLASLRDEYGRWLDDASPFSALEGRLRRHFRRLALLPLQFAGEPGFDLTAPFRSQGEYLLHVLERTPADVAVLVTEHPTALWLGDRIDDETRAFVAGAYPNARFVDAPSPAGASNALVRHVDDVFCVSSSVGLQALFWQKRLVVLGQSQLTPFADARTPEALEGDGPREPAAKDGAVGWLCARYYAPGALALDDGAWQLGFFERALRGPRDLSLYEPFESSGTSPRAYALAAPPPRHDAKEIAALLQNGELTDWSRGDGPFTESGPTADHWSLFAARGADIVVSSTVTPGAPCVRDVLDDAPPPVDALKLVRSAVGDGASFLLQRIPDVTKLAGATVTLELWARSTSHASLTVYFYPQLDAPGARGEGTLARVFALAPEWRRHQYTATLPEVPEGVCLGPTNHTELAFALPPEAGPCELELTGLALSLGAS